MGWTDSRRGETCLARRESVHRPPQALTAALLAVSVDALYDHAVVFEYATELRQNNALYRAYKTIAESAAKSNCPESAKTQASI